MKESSRRSPGAKPYARAKSVRRDGSRIEPDEPPKGTLEPEQIVSSGKKVKERAEAALSSVLYVQFPAKALDAWGLHDIPSETPIPVQLPGPIVKFDISMVSVESIIAGILRTLAWNPDNRHAGVYRQLATALRPGLIAELSDTGVSKALERDWDVAEEIFLALTGLYPEAPEPLLDLALLREEHAKLFREEADEKRAEEEDELAHSCYKRLLSLEPPFAPAYFHAALFFMRIRSFDRAMSLLTSYIGLGDDEEKIDKAKHIRSKLQELGYLDTTFKEAYDFIRLGDEEKGLERALQFVEKYPSVWNGWFLVGWAKRRLGSWKEAAEAFEQAISLGSKESDSYNELAICQMELGDYASARKNLERALAIEPENIKIIVNLGALAFKVGKRGEALGFFRSALEIDPDDGLARDWVRALEAGGEEPPDLEAPEEEYIKK
jgi:tetratricopeptide (TPR) repeat protein